MLKLFKRKPKKIINEFDVLSSTENLLNIYYGDLFIILPKHPTPAMLENVQTHTNLSIKETRKIYNLLVAAAKD